MIVNRPFNISTIPYLSAPHLGHQSHKALSPNKCNQNQKTFLLVTENNDTGYLKETILGRANFRINATVK